MILIAGSPRSGTSWLAKLLDSHPDVVYRHEPDSVVPCTQVPFDFDPRDDAAYVTPAREYLHLLPQVHNLKASGSLPIFRKSYRSSIQSLAFKFSVYSLRAVSLVYGYRGFVRRAPVPDLGEPLRRPGVVRVIKSVESLSRAALFLAAEPTLKVIHILRHPCAVAASLIRGIRLGKMPPRIFLAPLAGLPAAARHGLTLKSLEAMTLEEQIACGWMLRNETFLDNAHGNPRAKTVIYEELCCKPTQITQDVFRFAGLSWHRQTADFIRASESYRGNSERYFQVVRSPQKAAFRWRSQMGAAEIETILRRVADSAPARLLDARGFL